MNVRKLSLLALPLLAFACATPAGEDSAAGASDLSDDWFAANIPAGSAQETNVLALVNDSTMTAANFVTECKFTGTQAAAIISHREGDDLASKDDNEAFRSVAEVDALPFTDQTFWTKALACASTHIPGPPVCGSSPRLIIELVVDESASMSGDKWIAQRDSLLKIFADLKNAHDSKVAVGVELFSDEPNATVAPHALDQQQYDRLVAAVDKPSPKGTGTATQKAMEAAYDQVDRSAATAAPGARKVVVLLTDGVPLGGQAEQSNVISLAEDAFASASPTVTFAVGIGNFPADSGYDPAFVGRVAVAGGTAPAGCDPASTDVANVCHFQITPGSGLAATKQSLVTALKKISATVTPACP